MRLIPVLIVLSGTAAAREIHSDSPPIQGYTTDFDGMAVPADKNNFTFMLGTVMVTVTSDAANPYGAIDCSNPPNCKLSVWENSGLTLSFDPPVSGVAS